ncbi:MAG: hypothetical protein KDA96_00925 [Planctomycetaceae bacterium]|nr:hypothetical protein [Planctomycetaceae bacterium]
MRTTGKILLGFNLLFLTLGTLLVMVPISKYRSQYSLQLVKVQQESEDAIRQFADARSALAASEAKLAQSKFGWDREWESTVHNLQMIPVQGGNLQVNGLGSANGLAPRETPQGAQVAPTVHVFAFKDREQTASLYIGEFTADLGQLQPNAAILRPTWNVPQSEMQSWGALNNGFRLRTAIPMAERAHIDHLNDMIQQAVEQKIALTKKIQAQTKLLDDAKAQLEVRRGELLGNPNHPKVEGRPEYTDGLLVALRDLEDNRNDLQFSVDTLRRAIKVAADSRGLLLDEIVQYAQRLPAPAAQIGQRTE